MTLQQEAYEKIMKLPEDDVRLILVMADEIARQKGLSSKKIHTNKAEIKHKILDSEGTLTHKQKVFQEMLEMREKEDFPKDFDYKKVMEEAVNEKYGFTD